MPFHLTHRLPAVVALALWSVAGVTVTSAQPLVSGFEWMTQFPATWNAAAPKAVSDGLHTYAVLCGFERSANSCAVVRKRGLEEGVTVGRTFRAEQPPVMVLDRRARLNVFFNDPWLHHIRFDHPAVELDRWNEIRISYREPVGYLHASYDAVSDTIALAFNETRSWRLHVAVTTSARSDWGDVTPLPWNDSETMLLYARTVRANGRYFVLAGEHQRHGGNASYTAAILFESAAPGGPWHTRTLHRSTGANAGIPYQNWVYPLDLQVDPQGRVRALMHITEDGSGHPPLAEGLHLAREEDGYALRHVADGIDDGFVLHVDPSGLHLAFALRVANPRFTNAGSLVVFRSADNGATWAPAQAVASESALNPTTVEMRSGSMLGGKEVSFIYSAPLGGPFERVVAATIPLPMADTTRRYDFWLNGANDSRTYVRAFRDEASDREYYYLYEYNFDGSFAVSYAYRAGDYRQTYTGGSDGSFRYSNTDGFETSSTAIHGPRARTRTP